MADSFRHFLNAIGRYPLLTAEQEIELSRKIARYVELRDAEGERTAKEKRIMRIGERAKQKLMNCNLRLVVSISKTYGNKRVRTNLELCDLIQEGCIGLERAAEKYDGSRGYKFSTYAYWWIKQAINRCFDAQARLVRLPTNQLEQINKLYRYEIEFTNTHNRKPTVKEMAEFADKPVSEIYMWIERMQTHRSLDDLCREDGGAFIEFLADPSSYDDALDGCIKDEQMDKIKSGLDRLNDQQYEVISRRFLSGDSERDGATYAAIGRDIGLSRERTRQIAERAMMKLKLHARQ